MPNFDVATQNCQLYQFSHMSQGEGQALVVGVGETTMAGQIFAAVQNTQVEQTLLQQKLANMADQIGMVGLMCAVFTFIGTTVRIVLELMKFVPCGCQNIVNC